MLKNIIDSVEKQSSELGSVAIEGRLRTNSDVVELPKYKYCFIESWSFKNETLLVVHMEKLPSVMLFKIKNGDTSRAKRVLSAALEEQGFLIFKYLVDWERFLKLGNKFLITELLNQTDVESLDKAITLHGLKNLEGPFYTKNQFVKEKLEKFSDLLASDFYEIEYDGKFYYQPK